MDVDINSSKTIDMYKDTVSRILTLNFPSMHKSDLNSAINYSINKRLKDHPAQIVNNYAETVVDTTLLNISDYIFSREPILTGYGVMFKKHGTVPNPMYKVVNDFLENRYKHKGIMFRYEKGSEDYEYWNLVQSLDKIDANGIFGILTMNASLVYNIHVGASVLAQSRSQIASLSMLFEMFLANNVKFGSLNEVVVYIDNIVNERKTRTFNDRDILDQDIPLDQVFCHLILMCGWLWIPTEEEMNVIYDILQNLPQEDLNRIFYKNNLYEFCGNTKMKEMLHHILVSMDEPYMEPMKPAEKIKPELDHYRDLIFEYVYYGYQIPDRIDRNTNMIKSVIMISDTDSCIISLDAWFRFGLQLVDGEVLNLSKKKVDVFRKIKRDEFGDIEDTSWMDCVTFDETEYDYDFYNDDIVELEHKINPIKILPQDNLRYSIINIMCYVLDMVVNDYMERFTKANFSWSPDRDCKIIAKNEFLIRCALLSDGKKNYASYQEIQEGHVVAEDEREDIKGLQALTKANSPDSTKKALKKILLEEILMADNIDQLSILKKLAILEKQIINSINSGSKEYYKPVNIKSINGYDNPMRIQGIKASVAWNALREENDDPIDLSQRNHIDIAKVNINKKTVEKLRDWPNVYKKAVDLITNDKYFKSKGEIDAIAIPTTMKVPEWVIRVVDANTLCTDNIKGFPLESVGIERANKASSLSNMLVL